MERDQSTLQYKNLLGVPTEDEINGFNGDVIIKDFFPLIETGKGRKRQCKCCEKELSSVTSQSRLTYHLIQHALLVQSEFIKEFERGNMPEKLRCKTCDREVLLQNASKHSVSCQRKTKRGMTRAPERINQKEKPDSFGKRSFEDYHDTAYQNSNSNGNENENEIAKEQEEEEKIEKKVKTDSSRLSLTERGPLSLKNQLVSLFKKNQSLSERAFKLKLAEILEPFQKQWEDDQKRWKEEIQELKQAHIRDSEEKDKKIQELEKKIISIERQKEELEKLVSTSKDDLKQELTMEWETKFNELETRLSTFVLKNAS